MVEDIISYGEMCKRENGAALQHGMNFQLGDSYSVILMSRSPNAPYSDKFEDDGYTIIYEGHDMPKYKGITDTKSLDQPETTPKGSLTRNGKFHQAAKGYKSGRHSAEKVRVYEKLKTGIWIYNGVFNLTDSWIENDGNRNVFKFRLEAILDDTLVSKKQPKILKHRRIIPTYVKREVWKRDGGKCVQCGSADNLHFDHIIPFSKGGTSITSENVQILCARHNLQKSDDII